MTRQLFATAPWSVVIFALGLSSSHCNSGPQPSGRPSHLAQPTQHQQEQGTLPEVTRPTPYPAKHLIHVLYTSNVAGEAEPCG